MSRNAFECVICKILAILFGPQFVNTLRPTQNGRHFADYTSKRIFLEENVRISIKISLKFVPKSPIDNIPALFQIMAWCWPGDKPLSEPLMARLRTHICVTRPQWVNREANKWSFSNTHPSCPWLFIFLSLNFQTCCLRLSADGWLTHVQGKKHAMVGTGVTQWLLGDWFIELVTFWQRSL